VVQGLQSCGADFPKKPYVG